MISWELFKTVVVSKLKRDIENNVNQEKAITAPLSNSLFIVAGPGSGKTTVMVLKVLKLMFVDDIDPSSILITTFTKKAASELRSRILGWGDILKEILMDSIEEENREKLEKLDINRIKTGTLDSITEEVLREFREPGTPAPAVIEDFVAKALLLRYGLFNHGRFRRPELKKALAHIQGNNWGLNVPGMTDKIMEVKERLYHDQIDFDKLKSSKIEGMDLVCEAFADYSSELNQRFLNDYASLEQKFLKKLSDGSLKVFLDEIKFILVDEYQDSNLLQEKIYFEIAKAAIKNGGSITVVGDDDQSLYRFRGATVSLFQNFDSRMQDEIKLKPEKIFLSPNYRSTKNIVNFCNNFVTLDEEFQKARVQDKPQIVDSRSPPYENFPILGMFRDDKETLASDLADFIYKIVHGNGVNIDNRFEILIHPNGGPADISMLSFSPQEFNYKDEPRLPSLLRDKLANYKNPISVFNPRGQNLNKIEEVQILCGMLLECIDPNSEVQDNIKNLPSFTKYILTQWRTKGQNYIHDGLTPKKPSLKNFVYSWQKRKPLGRKKWEKNVSLMTIIYKLITWMPKMQSDIECLVYLESISRTINEAALFGSFKSEIIYDDENPSLRESSIREAIRNIFVPIATGTIDINEDLLDTLPSDRLNIMSIHQAKGLEFPLVIVDVGSDYKNLQSNSKKRFPKKGDNTSYMEDNLRKYGETETFSRSARNRAFDDLIRLYFVAFSRAQDILLLVGLNSVKNGYILKSGNHREIPNVATGWNRDEDWVWKKGLKNLKHI